MNDVDPKAARLVFTGILREMALMDLYAQHCSKCEQCTFLPTGSTIPCETGCALVDQATDARAGVVNAVVAWGQAEGIWGDDMATRSVTILAALDEMLDSVSREMEIMA
jgi:hypothetical protein